MGQEKGPAFSNPGHQVATSFTLESLKSRKTKIKNTHLFGFVVGKFLSTVILIFKLLKNNLINAYQFIVNLLIRSIK